MDIKFNKLILTSVITTTLVACSGDESLPSTTLTDQMGATDAPLDATDSGAARKTAPVMPVEIQSSYRTQAGRSVSVALTDDNAAEIENMVQRFNRNIREYNDFGNSVNKRVANERKLIQMGRSANSSYEGFQSLPVYDSTATYSTTTEVVYTENGRTGVFSNKWWTSGDKPSFVFKDGPWLLIVETDNNGILLPETETVTTWNAQVAYAAGDKVVHTISGTDLAFEAKYWTQGNEPILTKADDASSPHEEWDSPWKLSNLSGVAPELPDIGGGPDITVPPVCKSDCEETGTTPGGTPSVPPAIPTPPPPTVTNPPVYPELGENGLPEVGYEFLRKVSYEHWDWLFPMRKGRYKVGGGIYNMPPHACDSTNISQCGGKTTDVYTLDFFIEAVVEYNSWAAANGYKQFLNEGDIDQQATEFTIFWAKSSRETSGSWTNAPEPWAVADNSEYNIKGSVWKGALYWVEEVGFSTNEDGTSPAQSYIDTGSSFRPVAQRSYHGRGIIQLSWNYNYGAFSQWLFDNGLMTDVITSPTTLLENPGLVGTDSRLAVLSGIWFWMTPQGIKPASQDVVLGTVTNVSKSSTDLGLPPRNDNGPIKTAEGKSNDQAVVAYRIGTVINIVNGGLECNNAGSWHEGPLQRVAYYNGYAQYFNYQIKGLNIPLVDAGIDAWNVKINETTPDDLKTAACYAQKSYYGW